jgi:hypothetical protein
MRVSPGPVNRILCGSVVLLALLWGGVRAGAAPPAEAGALMGSDCRRVSAAVQPLAMVTNTRDRDYDCLGLSLDARAEVTAIRFETHPEASAANPAAPLVHIREFALSDVASADGAVLDGRPGHDAIALQGLIAAGAASSDLVLRFLYNGLTGEMRRCALTIDRVAREGGGWELKNAGGERVTQIRIRTRSLPLLGTIGIETIEGACPARD